MKKIYLVIPEKAGWILNDGAVIIADDEKEVKNILKKDRTFEKCQGKINITEIDLFESESKIILTSNVGA